MLNIQNLLTISSMQHRLSIHGQEIVKCNKKTGTYDKLELSTAGYKIADKQLEQSYVDIFNFEYTTSNVRPGPNCIIVDKVKYFPEQIPPITLEQCESVKASNNIINIEDKKYYKFMDSNGELHKLSCSNGHMTCPLSEIRRGYYDSTSANISYFWNIMAQDGTYINSHFSREEIKCFLNQTGVEDGFFTVKVGDTQQDYFYTNGTYCGPAILRSRYDEYYNGIINHGLFRDYKTGAIFEIDGEKYAVSEDGNLDIPYGIDIYNIKLPPKSERKVP